MRLMLVKIPGFAFLFFRAVLPVWNFVLSNLEALFYVRKRAGAKKLLSDMKAVIHVTSEMSRWYVERGFKWSRDPLMGLLDFSSKPWVSVAKNRGDCDDMMMLSREVLKPRYEECRRAYVYASDGRSHAILLLKLVSRDGVWNVMSNQRVLGPFVALSDAVGFFYGEKTRYSYVY